MSSTQANGSTTTEQPNAEVIAGLRELADLLDQHPELPKVRFSVAVMGSAFRENPQAREQLSLVARVLGDRAEERFDGSREVSIRGSFSGGVVLNATAQVSDLTDGPPPVPEYEPILPRRGYEVIR